jgi:hypothetical protein
MIKKFYNHNDLVLTKQEILKIETGYKEVIDNKISWEHFLTINLLSLERAPLVKEYCEKQMVNNKGLQGGKVFEIVVLTTIANIFNAKYIGNFSFETDEMIITLTAEKGKGTGTTKDLCFTRKDTGFSYIGEIKDEVARCGECDLKYDEEGHLYPTPRAKNWSPEWQPILDAFNAETSMFNIFGHNYKIECFTQACASVMMHYLHGVDFVFTTIDNKLVTIPVNETDIMSLFSFSGSEIRSNGKNPVNPFTKNYLHKQIINSEYFISENEVCYIMQRDAISEKKGRGGGKTTRYGFIDGFIVKQEGVVFNNDNTITIDKKSIKQLNSNISIHIRLVKNYQEIYDFYLGET